MALRAAACAATLLWTTRHSRTALSGQDAGRRLRDLARRACGLIYSRRDGPGLVAVRQEPTATTPAAVLDAVLAEHGLRARRTGTDSYGSCAKRRPAPRGCVGGTDTASGGGRGNRDRGEPLFARRERCGRATFLTQDEIEGLPPARGRLVKAVQRLPGPPPTASPASPTCVAGSNETHRGVDGLRLRTVSSTAAAQPDQRARSGAC